MGSKKQYRLPFGLGAVQRQVRLLQQLIRVVIAARTHGDADGNADRGLDAFERERLRDRVDGPRSERGCVGLVIGAVLKDRELVAAEPRDDIRIAHAAEQPFANLLQQQVSDSVPVSVVDRLEAVEVEPEHGEGFVAALPARECPDKLLPGTTLGWATR